MYFRPSRAKTIRPQNGIYQKNCRVDAKTHDRIEDLKAHYKSLTGLSTNTGVIMRRAIRLLSDQIHMLDQEHEDQIIRQCGKGEERPKQRVKMPDRSLNN